MIFKKLFFSILFLNLFSLLKSADNLDSANPDKQKTLSAEQLLAQLKERNEESFVLIDQFGEETDRIETPEDNAFRLIGNYIRVFNLPEGINPLKDGNLYHIEYVTKDKDTVKIWFNLKGEFESRSVYVAKK